MYNKPADSHQATLFGDLESMLNQKHSLYILANLIDWDVFESGFKKHYSSDNGRPSKPVRLMTGLLMLKHIRNISDESVVEQFTENAYYQYFCGKRMFCTEAPCAASELVHFRHRIGEDGIELILKESIRVNVELEDRKKAKDKSDKGQDNRGRKPDDEQIAFIDSTVQEKNVTFPTDSKLLNRVCYCHTLVSTSRIANNWHFTTIHTGIRSSSCISHRANSNVVIVSVS